MNNSEETLEQPTQNETILQAITALSNKLDDYKKDTDTQFETIRQKIDDYKKESDAKFETVRERFESVDVEFEAIRQGIVHNSVAFDRLKAEVLLLRNCLKTQKLEHFVFRNSSFVIDLRETIVNFPSNQISVTNYELRNDLSVRVFKQLLSPNVKELTEEVRYNKKVLV